MGWKYLNEDRIAEVRRRLAALEAILSKNGKVGDAQKAHAPETDYWSAKLEERRLLLEELDQLLKDGM